MQTLTLDTELLEALLGDVLEEQEGRAFRDRVFWLRETAAQLRDGDDDAGERLVGFISRLSSAALEPCVRACSMQLQLANIAEELERLRRRRQHDSDTSAPQRESLAATRAAAALHPAAQVNAALGRLDVVLLGQDPAADLWETICSEHERVVATMLEIAGTETLLANAPNLLARLSHRNPWIDPLSHMQIDLLRRTRARDELAEAPLLLTVNGIAAGMRNTG